MMGLVKKDSSLDIINVIDINNKDLFIVSLLEYICNINNGTNMVFQTICNHLKESSIIDNEDVCSLESSYQRQVYIKIIDALIKCHNSLEDKSNTNNTIVPYNCSNNYPNYRCNERYKSDFIEIEEIGKGGFGDVYKVCNKLDNNMYAIKKISIEDNNNLNEVRNLSILNHKNIVRYYSAWIEIENNSKITLYMQMELCSRSLFDYLEDRNYNNMYKNEKDIIKQIIKGVKYIHSMDIIHRDLSTRNIFLDISSRIKIGDFGLSVKEEDNMKIDDSYGNLIYMAPEIERNIIVKASDIYSLGIIYFELITVFKTLMERNIAIKNLKQGKIINNNIVLIKKMICEDYNQRPTIKEIDHILSTTTS